MSAPGIVSSDSFDLSVVPSLGTQIKLFFYLSVLGTSAF